MIADGDLEVTDRRFQQAKGGGFQPFIPDRACHQSGQPAPVSDRIEAESINRYRQCRAP